MQESLKRLRNYLQLPRTEPIMTTIHIFIHPLQLYYRKLKYILYIAITLKYTLHPTKELTD
jgi:hypothetical protein